MKKQTFGMMVAALRKEKGMTQQELADKMFVTDKAVSKWERDLSYPDVDSIPRLAEIFGISVDELMQVKTESTRRGRKDFRSQMALIFRCISVAMGIAVLVLSSLNKIETDAALRMLGLGLALLAVSALGQKEAE